MTYTTILKLNDKVYIDSFYGNIPSIITIITKNLYGCISRITNYNDFFFIQTPMDSSTAKQYAGMIGKPC